MKRKRSGRWQIILAIVAVCFFVGTVAGAASAGSLSEEQAELLCGCTVQNEADFTRLFLKHGKYIFAMWLAGLASSGAVVILITIFTLGLFYGFSSAFVTAGSVLAGILPQSTILVPMYIFSAVWSVNFIVNNLSNNGPKSRIKREKIKHLKEHMVILAICLLMNAAGCLAEIYAAKMVPGILNIY